MAPEINPSRALIKHSVMYEIAKMRKDFRTATFHLHAIRHFRHMLERDQ